MAFSRIVYIIRHSCRICNNECVLHNYFCGICGLYYGGRVPELFAKYPNLYGDLSANSGSRAIMRDPEFGLWFLETYADRLFDRQLPGDRNGSWHSSDLWYWFGTLENCWRPMEETDRSLSEQMVHYLCNFVKNGDPNRGEAVPRWDPAQSAGKKVLRMGESPAAMVKPSMLKLIKTMLTNKAVGE